MKIITILLSLFCIVSFHAQDTLSIFYPVNEHALTPAHRLQLSTLLSTGIIGIYAHTDVDASVAYNIDLSKRRLHGVKDYFKSNGHDMAIISLQALGETQRQFENKRQNRRVDVIYKKLPVQAASIDINQQALTIKQQLFGQLKGIDPCKKSFCINANRDTLLIGKRGTVVKIQAGSFKNVKGCVEITITEPGGYSDMILYNLTTQTKRGDLLISDGMVLVEAKYDQKIIQPIKPVIILKPTKKIDPEMKLFVGNTNANEQVVWEDPAGKLKMLGSLSDEDLHRLFGPGGGDIGDICGESDFLAERCKFFFCRVKKAFQSKEKKQSIRTAEINRRLAFDSLQNWCADRTAFLKEIEKNFNPLDEADLSKIPANQVNYYVFQANRLGWMNLDKLAKFSGKRVAFKIKLEAQDVIDVKLAFMKFNAMISGTIEGEYIVFNNVPVNYKVKVIAFEFCQPPKMGIGITKTSRKPYADLKMEEHSVEEMQNMLWSL